MNEPRYKVVNESVSSHCCFSATVTDSAQQCGFQTVCECFDVKDAELVASALNAARLNFDPNKQHIVFYKRTEDLCRLNVPADVTIEVVTPSQDDAWIGRFNSGLTKMLVLRYALLTGWRTSLTDEQVDVHFTWEPDLAESGQGQARLRHPLDVE